MKKGMMKHTKYWKTALFIQKSIVQQEKAKDATCWTTVRMMEHFYAGLALSEHATLLKIEASKLLLYRIWSYASRLSQTSLVKSKDIERSVPFTLLQPSKTFTSQVRSKDYHKVTEHWRVLLAIFIEGFLGKGMFTKHKPSLKPLSSRAAEKLTEISTKLTVRLLRLARERARKQKHRYIQVEDVKASFLLLSQALEKHHKLKRPSTFVSKETLRMKGGKKKLIAFLQKSMSLKIRALRVWNRSAWKGRKSELVALELLNKIAPTPISKKGFQFLQTFLVRVARHILEGNTWMQSDNLISFVYFLMNADMPTSGNKVRLVSYLDVLWLNGVMNNLFPRRTLKNGDVEFFFRKYNSKKVYKSLLIATSLDAVRDTTLPWMLVSKAYNQSKKAVPAGPFALELLVERLSEFTLLWVTLAGKEAKKAGAKKVSPSTLMKVINQPGLQLLPPRVKSSKWSQQLRSTKSKLMKSYRIPLFADITFKTGISTKPCKLRVLISPVKEESTTSKPTTQRVKKHPPKPIPYRTLGIQRFMGGGIAVGDYDNDGRPDLFFSGEGCNRLYRNVGGYRFLDVTKKVGISDFGYDSRQAIFADVNGDGLLDLFVVHSHRSSRLFIQTRKGSFVDKTRHSKILTARGAHTAVFFDYDNDGLLDLYVGVYGAKKLFLGKDSIPSVDGLNGGENQLFHNEGNGRFREVGKKAGVNSSAWTLASAALDINRDGHLDLFLANDFGHDQAFLNLGNGRFKEVAKKMRAADRGSGMNVSYTDFNGDGFWDIYVSVIDMFSKSIGFVLPKPKTLVKLDDRILRVAFYLSGNKFWLNQSGKHFTNKAKIFEPGDRGWAWSANFFDFENDGDDDLFLANGWIANSFAKFQRNQLYIQHKGHFFHFKKPAVFSYPGHSRSVAAVDLSGSGSIDLVLNDYQKGIRVFRNLQKTKNRWIKIRLRGKRSNFLGIGASIQIKVKGLRWQMRQVSAGSNYLSQDFSTVTFGVGKALLVEKIRVFWPNGKKQLFKGPFKTNKILVLKEL